MSLTWFRMEPGRPVEGRCGFWMLIGWGSCGKSRDGYCWGSHGIFVGVNRRGTRLSRFSSETCGEISLRGTRRLGRWHWFWKIWSGELRRFGVVNMDCPLQSIIFVCQLILVGDAANTKGPLSSRCQLGGSLRRGGHKFFPNPNYLLST